MSNSKLQQTHKNWINKYLLILLKLEMESIPRDFETEDPIDEFITDFIDNTIDIHQLVDFVISLQPNMQ